MQTELIRECFFPFNFFNIFRASFLFSGLEINSPFKSITLSAPRTSISCILLLTLFALSSAKFFDIISGDAPSLSKLYFTGSSSMLDGFTEQIISWSFKIFSLTLLFDANII